jgi:hypothetical protein
MSNDLQTNDDLAEDLLRGANAIADFLNSIGFGDVTVGDVYYLRRANKVPIAKFGKELIASKSKIVRHTRKLIA